MATVHSRSLIDHRSSHSLSIARLAAATGMTAAAVLVLCWLGAFVPFFQPTHAYISLFTNAEITSGLALAEGICWSLVFGLIVGAVFALVYNAAAPLGRR